MHGRNELAEKTKPTWRLFCEQFVEPMPCVIWVAIAIELGLAIKYGTAWPDFGVLMGLQAINGTVSFYEANKAGNAIAALKASLKPGALCKRDGTWHKMEAALLVPGDLVKLDAGAHVPADCVINDGCVQVDQSALTGESMPVTMHGGGETMMSSTITRGEVEATVKATGGKTFFGRTASMIGSVDAQPRFQKVLLRIMLFLISISVILCSTVLGFLIGMEKQSFETAISITVVLLVVSVPLAMEVVTTTTMALGSRKLSTEGAIVARLSSIEELAGMDLLCSDKTGTLTLNKMAIQEETPLYEEHLSREGLLLYAALATKWREPAKDAIDALVLGAVDMSSLGGFDQLDFVPFDPREKRNEASLRDVHTGEVFKVTKGAPHVLALLLHADDAAVMEAIDAATNSFAARGIRTLAVARTRGERWCALGLLTFTDPPRPDTMATLKKAATLGVSCKMITGDSVLIARETARQLELGTDIINAVGLPSLGKDGQPPANLGSFASHIIEADGFAQVFPEHKFLIVEVLRRAGYSVGMTGDGVNDAPALKRADIGIAVQGATDAARASADIVLTQPGLSTIITAITSARRICRRIQSFVIYRVACTLQILVFFYIAIIAFQPSNYSLGHRSETQNIPLALFGPEGKPGGTLVLWAHGSCPARTLDLAYIEHGVEPYATGVSVASILARSSTPHSAEWNFVHAKSGVGLDAAADTVSGRLCVEQWPRTFSLPLLALIFITVLNDGTIISIAYDRVRAANHPEVWRLGRLFVISSVLGLVALASSLLFLHILLESHNPSGVWQQLGFSPLLYGHVTAAIFLKVSLSDYLTLFCARTRSWVGSIRPSLFLVSAAFVALGASTTLAARWPKQLNGEHLDKRYLQLAGFQEHTELFDSIDATSGVRMKGLSNRVLGFTWIYCLLWWVIMDAVKCALYAALKRYDRRVGAVSFKRHPKLNPKLITELTVVRAQA